MNLLFSSRRIFSRTYFEGSGPKQQSYKWRGSTRSSKSSISRAYARAARTWWWYSSLRLGRSRSADQNKNAVRQVIEARKKNRRRSQKYTPSIGTSHFRSNLGTSPQKSSNKVSQPDPETKKYHDFQSRKDEGKLVTILDFLSQGRSSKYP